MRPRLSSTLQKSIRFSFVPAVGVSPNEALFASEWNMQF